MSLVDPFFARWCSALCLVALVACGDDMPGGPGDPGADAGTDAPPPSPAPAVSEASLAAGNHFTVVRDPASGDVVTMGENARAQLGMGLVSDEVGPEHPYPSPRTLALPATIVAVYAGELHGLAVTRAGELYAWGLNNVGATGHGASPLDPTVQDPGCASLPTGPIYDGRPNHHICSPAPVRGISGVQKIAAGNGFTLALTTDGKVYSWGNNSSGQLGHGDTTRLFAPMQIAALANQRIVDIAAGNSHVLAVTREGAVFAWGANRDGQLGQGPLDPNPTTIPMPVRVTGLSDEKVISLGTANFSSFAVTESKKLFAWGENDFGQLGLGSFDNDQPTPQQVTLPAGVTPAWAGGGSRHAYLRTAEGRVYSWGRVGEGQLGNGRFEGAAAEYVLTPEPIALFSQLRVVELLSAPSHALALTDEGVIYGWGSNGQGRLGLGTTFDLGGSASIPVPLDLSPAISGPPVHAASKVTFLDSDPAPGSLGGTLTITRASSEVDLDGYTVSWASGFGQKLPGIAPLARPAKSGATLTIEVAAGTLPPAGATHLLVTSRNHRGEMELGPSVALVDLGATP